jgi:hypothetical protein
LCGSTEQPNALASAKWMRCETHHTWCIGNTFPRACLTLDPESEHYVSTRRSAPIEYSCNITLHQSI